LRLQKGFAGKVKSKTQKARKYRKEGKTKNESVVPILHKSTAMITEIKRLRSEITVNIMEMRASGYHI